MVIDEAMDEFEQDTTPPGQYATNAASAAPPRTGRSAAGAASATGKGVRPPSHKSTGKRKQIEEDDAEMQLLGRDSEEVCSLPASTLTSLRLI